MVVYDFSVDFDDIKVGDILVVTLNAVLVVTILMILMQNCVFMMLLRTLISKYSIQSQERMKRGIKNGMKRVNLCNSKQRWNKDKCRSEYK